MEIETNGVERYRSFSFWLMKSIWLGLTAASLWVLYQLLFKQADITDEMILFTNGLLRIISILAFGSLIWYFGSRLFNNWQPDAEFTRAFEADVKNQKTHNAEPVNAFASEPKTGVKPPPPFEAKPKSNGKKDDLTVVEGIGPKINEILNAGGIGSFADLANKSQEELQDILTGAGERFRFHDPSDWAEQAQLALDKQWDELQRLQDARN